MRFNPADPAAVIRRQRRIEGHRHVIDICCFSEGLILCKCGESCRANCPSALRLAFAAHRVAHGCAPKLSDE